MTDLSDLTLSAVSLVPETLGGDSLLGFDVNDFTSRIVYAVFNDPEAPEHRDLSEAIKEQLCSTHLYDDEDLSRVVRHARLMNEDRGRMKPPRSPVLVRQRTILETPWETVPLEDA